MDDQVVGRSRIMKIIIGALLGGVITAGVFASGSTEIVAHGSSAFSIASGIFMTLVMFLVITLVATEKVHRTELTPEKWTH